MDRRGSRFGHLFAAVPRVGRAVSVPRRMRAGHPRTVSAVSIARPSAERDPTLRNGKRRRWGRGSGGAE
eukprot:scaffold66437_cov18-Tisochrysis_lutea.AAC.1